MCCCFVVIFCSVPSFFHGSSESSIFGVLIGRSFSSESVVSRLDEVARKEKSYYEKFCDFLRTKVYSLSPLPFITAAPGLITFVCILSLFLTSISRFIRSHCLSTFFLSLVSFARTSFKQRLCVLFTVYYFPFHGHSSRQMQIYVNRTTHRCFMPSIIPLYGKAATPNHTEEV